MPSTLTTRDLEVLRTLLRVQLAPARLLEACFFQSRRTRQRRLQRLTGLDYIARHTKGLPVGYASQDATYWRLTRRGVDAVGNAFPRENIPTAAAERAADSSLRYFEHRDALADLYVSLIGDSSWEIKAMAERADAIEWNSERNGTLAFDDALDGARILVPDATIVSPARKQRLFIEIDRSSEAHSVCVQKVEDYLTCFKQGGYQRQFADRYGPVVVFVVRSERRQRGLDERFCDVHAVKVLAVPEAASWLRHKLFGDALMPIVPAAEGTGELVEAVSLLEAMYGFAQRQLRDWKRLDVDVELPPEVRDVKRFIVDHNHLRKGRAA